MKRPTKLTVIGSVLALALGAAAAGIKSASASGSAAPGASGNVAKSSVEEPEVDPALRQAVTSENGAGRWMKILSAAEHATAREMPTLIRLAGDDSAMVRMLAARWAELDPVHMFNSLYADYLLPEGTKTALPSRWELTDVLFEEWIKRDRKAAVKALNEVPNFSGRENLRMTVFNEVFKSDVEEGFRLMNEWNIRHYSPGTKAVEAWAAKDPQHAAEVVVHSGTGYFTNEALRVVGKVWAEKDPEGGLRYAATLPGANRASLAAEVMKKWAERDLKRAVQFASDEPSMLARASFALGLVSTWGKQDAAGAIAWSDANLQGTARTEAIGDVVKAAAAVDLTKAGELVAGMEPGAAQNRAAAGLFETWFKKGPDERNAAFEWLESLPDVEGRRAAMEKVSWDWMWREPDAVKAFVSGPHGNLAPESMIGQVARNQASKNPEQAMEWAKQLPSDRTDRAQNMVLEQWLQVRPDGAAEYAKKLPKGEARDRAVRTVTGTLMWGSVERLAEWYRSLPPDEKSMVETTYKQSGMPEEKRKQLEPIFGAGN